MNWREFPPCPNTADVAQGPAQIQVPSDDVQPSPNGLKVPGLKSVGRKGRLDQPKNFRTIAL
jgi:hypothetical protein